MIRRHLSRLIPITLITGFALVSLILVAGAVFATPMEVQQPPATPIPLVQTLNARMANVFSPDSTPTPEVDELSDLIAELPKSRTENGGFVLGDPDAPVTLVVFEDFGCPHCQAYHETVEAFITDYVATGEAALESRIFPTAGGDLTVQVAQLLECGEEQREGFYWENYSKLYALALAGNYNTNTLSAFFAEVDIDRETALLCVETAEQVLTDIEYARSLEVTGTPAVRVRFGDEEPTPIDINGSPRTGGGIPLEAIAQIVEAANS